MNITSKLQKLRIIIVTHEYATGPSHALEQHLKNSVTSLVFVAHPFVFAKEKRSHMRRYINKRFSGESFFPWHVPVQFLNIFKDIALTVWWCLRSGPVDLYIGVNNINACIGIFFKKIGLVKRVVFYTIDYIPNRFSNPIANYVYHALDAYAVKHADVIWNLSSIMEKERANVGLSSRKIRKKQIVVPVGTDATVPSVPFRKIKRYHLAHMGHLTRKQGVQIALKAIPLIVKKLPKFHLDIIGGGPMEQELRQIVKELHVDKYVTFFGFIKSHDAVGKILAKDAAAIAPYVDSQDNFVRYTDPGKVKAYLAVGLPVIITKVPDVWETLVTKEAGIATESSAVGLARGIILLLSDEKKLRTYRKNAVDLGKEFLWSHVFETALAHSLH